MTSTSPKVRSMHSLQHKNLGICFANMVLVRTTRARIIYLRNDYKALMSKIERGLHEHHASYQASNLADVSNSVSQGPTRTADTATNPGLAGAPFAKVNSVVPGSPADQAGLKAGDRIRKFGDVDWLNHDKLSKVAETVQRNQGVGPFVTYVVVGSR